MDTTIQQDENKETPISWIALFFIFTTALLPHITLLHDFFPLRLFEKSIWLAGLCGLLGICSIYAMWKLQDRNLALLVTTSFILQVVPSVFRFEFFGGGLFSELVMTRPLTLLPLMFACGFYYLKDQRIQKTLLWIIITTGFVQAIIGILHFYVFPEIVTGYFATTKGKLFYVDSIAGARYLSRESGTQGNPAYYADLITLSAFAWSWAKPKIKSISTFMNFLYHSVFYGVLLTGLMPSLCRLPIIFTCLFIFLGIVGAQNIKKLIVPGIVFLFLMLIVVINKFPHLLKRFTEAGFFGGRDHKNQIMITEVTNDWMNFLIGIPQDFKKTLRTLENSGFGDNSYLTLFSVVGVPVTILWFLNFALFFKSEFKLSKSILFLSFIAFLVLNYSIGDTINADGWNLFIILIICMVASRSNQSYLQRISV